MIRIATPADAAMINDVYEHYITQTVATFNERNKTLEARADEMETLLKDYPFLIAENEAGEFLGFACAEPIRSQTGYRYCAELTIYLHPKAPKGAGTGSALYEQLLAILHEQGFCRAIGVLYAGNEASIALHKHFGFQQAAFFPCAAYKHGQWLDMVMYAKQLNPFADNPPPLIPFCEYRKRFSGPYLNPLAKTQE